METANRIKVRRVQIGLDHKTVAAKLEINEPSYWDLEAYEDEVIDTLSFAQALKLATTLQADLSTLLGIKTPSVVIRETTLEELGKAVADRLATGALAKESLPWDIEKLVSDPSSAMEMPIRFLMDIAPLAECDWASIVLHYSQYPK